MKARLLFIFLLIGSTLTAQTTINPSQVRPGTFQPGIYNFTTLEIGTPPTYAITLQAPLGMTDNPVQTYQDANGQIALVNNPGSTSAGGTVGGANALLNGNPVTAPPSAVSLGGTISTCAASTLGCLNANCGGTPCQIALLAVGSTGATTVSLSANPTTITSGGSSVLTWSSTNASSCTGTNFTISGSATSGTATVSPTTTTTYTATCNSVAATATVTVGTASPLPTPPSGAFVVSNIQNGSVSSVNGGSSLNTWTPCYLPGCNPGGSSPGAGTVSTGNTTITRSGSSLQLTSIGSGVNFLSYKKFGCTTAPSGGTTTVGTLTTTVGTPTVGASTVSISASAADTTYTVTTIQIYLDGGATPIFSSMLTPPITPISYTISGLSGSHVIVVKSWDSIGTQASVSINVTLGGATCASVTNLLDDLWFWIDTSSTTLTALEFDPDMSNDGGYTYSASMQCQASSSHWRYWNELGGAWVDSGYSCGVLSQKGSWHHFQLYATINHTAHTYTYVALVVDGVTVFSGGTTTYSAQNNGWSNNLWVQEQIDNTSSTGTNMVYYDTYTLSAW